MDAKVYWRCALGLLWAFMFFVLLSLVVGMVYLSKLAIYPYAVLSAIVLVVFLIVFSLFHKRSKAGLHLLLVVSALFVVNQALTLYFILTQPGSILPAKIYPPILEGTSPVSPTVVSTLLLLWGIVLFLSAGKSRDVFDEDMRREKIAWLQKIKKEVSAPAKSKY